LLESVPRMAVAVEVVAALEVEEVVGQPATNAIVQGISQESAPKEIVATSAMVPVTLLAIVRVRMTREVVTTDVVVVAIVQVVNRVILAERVVTFPEIARLVAVEVVVVVVEAVEVTVTIVASQVISAGTALTRGNSIFPTCKRF